jgi:RNA polymerase sigma-54 factor
MTAMEMAASDTTLAMHLHGQLNVMPLSQRDLLLSRAIVESLDEDGYLRTPLDEIAAVLPLDPPTGVEELQIAVRLVQSLEPAGVAARSVAECLLLQCPQIEDVDLRQLAHRILQDHLQALAAHDVLGLAALLGVSAGRIEAAIERIRRLDPHPGWRLGSSRVDYVVPDVIVRRSRGRWTVQLNPAVVPRVRLNQVYADLFQRHRSDQHGELVGHLQDARWTLRNVEQRFSTILDVAQAIVRRQRHFLEFGAMAMKPLVLREIADEVGVHESTVSRVTNNKYMATPAGVFELKYFFSRPMVSASGSACSATAIRGLIGDIIEAEDRTHPLSDAEITRQLARQGLVVARRTVTKYRQVLRIEPVDKRRRHA